MEQSMEVGMQDPNNTDPRKAKGQAPTKIEKTDMSGVSGRPTGSDYSQSLASEKAWYPTAGSSGLEVSAGPATEDSYANGGANKLFDENNTAG